MASTEYLRFLSYIEYYLDDYEPDMSIEDAWQYVCMDYDNLMAPDRLLKLSMIAFKDLSQLTELNAADLIANARQLHVGKNAGYAGTTPQDPWSNFREANRFQTTPYVGALIRLGDKIARIRNLKANPANEQVNESIAETLSDAGAYPLISACLFAEANDLSIDAILAGEVFHHFDERSVQV